jgi:hypothetical protein
MAPITKNSRGLKTIFERSFALDKITVLDKEGRVIGETFNRRAKQLVLKERATWTDEKNSAIRLLKAELTEGDEIMENQNMPFMDLRAAERPHEEISTPSEDLLMYLARRNIRFRRGLLTHIIAMPAAFLALAWITGGFRVNHFDSGFYTGFAFAWGLLILYKIAVLTRQYLYSRGGHKKDPITAEYNRLKSTSPANIAQELKH